MLSGVDSSCEQGLSGEFEAQIALSIREQLQDYSRVRPSNLSCAAGS